VSWQHRWTSRSPPQGPGAPIRGQRLMDAPRGKAEGPAGHRHLKNLRPRRFTDPIPPGLCVFAALRRPGLPGCGRGRRDAEDLGATVERDNLPVRTRNWREFASWEWVSYPVRSRVVGSNTWSSSGVPDDWSRIHRGRAPVAADVDDVVVLVDEHHGGQERASVSLVQLGVGDVARLDQMGSAVDADLPGRLPLVTSTTFGKCAG
jgi:hypothetical protein